ncbi:MAG: hypothetical protein HN348_16740 [Proteobacteria bacterium]|jgi:uncharacterized membrane protein YhdT|nr:hypothetical protein [Pseudomonadota bacterium]
MRAHIDFVALALAIWGAIQVATSVLIGGIYVSLGAGFGLVGLSGGEEEMALFGALFVVIGLMVAVLTLLFAVPALVAAYGVRKRAPWGRIMAFVVAVMACMSFPLGMIVGIYTLITMVDKDVTAEFGMT